MTYVEDHEDRDELREAERDPELEGGEGGDHRGAALPEEQYFSERKAHVT